jgi:aryl-alcohol dehydrogenase-like predicted oxidoreductase
VATKFGRDGSVYPDRYSEDALRQSVDASRERLGVEVLDCIQLHCIPMVEMQKGDVFDWLRALKDEGAIRDFGASVETVDEGLVCLEQEGLASLQVIFNLFRQKLVAELLPQAKAADVSIIVRLPLASGLLAGKFTKDTTFSADDHRTFNRDGQMFNVGETFAGLPFETGVELTERLRELLPGGITMAQASLRWILDHDAVTTVIPGASSVAQAEGNAAASGLAPFSPELHEALAEFYRTRVVQHIRGPY